MFPDYRHPLRYLHASRTERSGSAHLRGDQLLFDIELFAVDLVQEGFAEVYGLGGRSAYRVAYRERTTSSFVVSEKERSHVEG